MAGYSKAQQLKPKIKIWSNNVADAKFSDYVRQRDGRCLFSGCVVTDLKKLQCSHYIGRRHSATRYDPKNCISLCWKHHFKDKLLGFEYQKQTKDAHGYDGQYTLFMKRWLGQKEFDALIKRANSTYSRKSSIVDLMVLLSSIT